MVGLLILHSMLHVLRVFLWLVLVGGLAKLSLEGLGLKISLWHGMMLYALAYVVVHPPDIRSGIRVEVERGEK